MTVLDRTPTTWTSVLNGDKNQQMLVPKSSPCRSTPRLLLAAFWGGQKGRALNAPSMGIL